MDARVPAKPPDALVNLVHTAIARLLAQSPPPDDFSAQRNLLAIYGVAALTTLPLIDLAGYPVQQETRTLKPNQNL